MSKIYTVTKDISADLRKLKALEKKGVIKVYQVKIENYTKKIKNTDLSNFVFDYSLFGEGLLGSEEDAERFEKIKAIIGKDKIGDALHLDTHLREKRDYFVTEDTDFLRHRSSLEKEFKGLKIRNTEELVRAVNN